MTLLDRLKRRLKIDSLRLRRNASHKGKFESSLRAGELEIVGGCEIDLCYGLSQAEVAIRSGHHDEFLGLHEPRFPIRALWMQGSAKLDFADRAIEFGYNTIILETASPLIPEMQARGIKIGLKTANIDECACDFIFWESQLDPFKLEDPELTFLDTVINEIQTLERRLKHGCRLIYFLPSLTADQILQLSHAVGPCTILAFKAEHALWDGVRTTPEPSSTPLLPIFPKLSGGGLWPILTLPALDRLNDSTQPFAGAIVTTDTVPAENGLLAANLWSIGQLLWSSRSFERLLESWFDAFQPELAYRDHVEAIKIATEIANQLFYLASLKLTKERSTHRLELLIAKLKYLDQLYATLPESLSFSHYFHYFSRDAWCLLYWHLDRLRLSLPGVPPVMEHKGGFWTSINPNGGRSVPGATTVTLLDRPQSIPSEAHMRAILQQIQ